MAYLDSHGLTTLWSKIKGTFITDAPSDNKEYVRKNHEWAEASGGESENEHILAFSLSVPTSAWASDSTMEDFPYRAFVAVNDMKSFYPTIVEFSRADALGGTLCPLCDATNGGVYIYASEVPTSTVFIEWISAIITERTLNSISVTTNPTKTKYQPNESLDLTGMVVTGNFDIGTEVLTDYTTVPANGTIVTEDVTEVLVSYTEDGVTKTTTVPITVKATCNITITGTGNSSYCYAMINGEKQYSAGTFEVDKGTNITLGVYGRSSTYYGNVTVNGSETLKVTNATTQTTTYTVNSDINMSMSYTSTSSQRRGRIAITT